jgi:NAD(P)-dependent dehydrogenase (short-subunit alcohol dehydrogenase family)
MAEVSLAGKVAIITGAARGMGRELALGFARAGAKGLLLFDLDSERELKKLAGEIGKDRAAPFSGDVTRSADCKRAVGDCLKRFGGLHVVVNNAALGPLAVSTDRSPFWQNDVKGWKRLIDVNINGPFYLSRAAAPHLKEQGWGRIINISKNREAMHQGGNSPYGPSKAALDAATLCWAQDLLDSGVTVNSLQPGGAVDTDFLEPDSRVEGRASGRLLPANVMVKAGVWLASERSDAFTGCRFTGKFWDDKLAPDEAAARCREESIFRPPRRPSRLGKTWEAS